MVFIKGGAFGMIKKIFNVYFGASSIKNDGRKNSRLFSGLHTRVEHLLRRLVLPVRIRGHGVYHCVRGHG